MSKYKFKLGAVTIDAQAYGSQGNAILGIRDSGKTYTATEIAEHLFECGIPFITFDPTGVWRFLRVPGKGRGYPIVVAGGKGADLPLTVAGAVEIVRAAMKNGVSLVLDLTDPNLSKSDWKRIVKACVRVLLQENAAHGLRHVFIEEAAEFVPQRVLDGDVYAEVEKLARIGGNSRLGYTLINQRSQEVNKAVLELCENLFLHRQRGKNAIQSLDHWLGVAGVDQAALVKSLPMLPSGHCWAWMGDRAAPTLIEVPPKNSFHPDRRAMHGTSRRSRKAVDVGSFVKDMRTALVSLEQEAAANDPTKLKAEVARLNAEITKLKNAKPPAPDKDALKAAEQKGFEQGKKKVERAFKREAYLQVRDRMMGMRQIVMNTLSQVDKAIAEWKKQEPSLAGHNVAFEPSAPPAPAFTPPKSSILTKPAAKLKPVTSEGGDGEGEQQMPPTVRKILDEIHRANPVALSFEAAALRAGVSRRSSAYGRYERFVEASPEVERREDGRWRSAPGFAVPIQPGADPIETFAARLPPSYASMLRAIATSSLPMSRDEVAAAANVSPTSSGLARGLGELVALNLLQKEGPKGAEMYTIHQELRAAA